MPPSPTAVADAARYFDTWLAFHQRVDRIPGVQAAVSFDGELLLSTAHGLADIESGTALTPTHRFRVASHSKTFTATAVMQLVERGVVHLDDPLGRWIGELDATPSGGVTIRELLAHGGGVIRDGQAGDFWQLGEPFPDADELVAIALEPPVLARNERFKYSNIGYGLLGVVVEQASGQPYAAYVTEHIVERLRLPRTAAEVDPAWAAELATGYSGLGYAERRIPIDSPPTGALASATGFCSTAEDLVAYAAAHFPGDERLVGDDAKRQMQRTEWVVERADSSYGLGFGIAEVGGRRVLGHGGAFPGHLSRTWFDPIDRIAVSVLTNAIDAPPLGLANALFRLTDLAAQGEPDPAAADLGRFCGRFANLWGVFDVVALDDRLFQIEVAAPDPGAAPVRLDVVDDRTVRIVDGGGYGSYGEVITFEFDTDGAPRRVRSGSAVSYPFETFAGAAGGRAAVTAGDPLRAEP